MKKALILHAWYNNPTSHWYPWLKDELEKKKYTVCVPELPTMNTDLPDMKKQLRSIENLHIIDPDTTLIGHSLGCLLALRVAEKIAYKKMILVAGWDFDDGTTPGHKLFWPNKIDHAAIKTHVKKIYCISSDNDPYTPATQVEDMSKRLKGVFILIKGAGHFVEKDGITCFPELLPLL
ncbi:serine hydrolase family protein [Candidatus Gottesmanbacteria bacterium]|nr:serine hydrolase family protein [Candidatus Gottesmanbacteria bacterium]